MLCSDGIIGVMKTCIAPETPVPTGECDMMANTTSGWHKDIASDMQLGTGILADEEFRVYRLATYLQDQPPGLPSHARGPAGDASAGRWRGRRGRALASP